MVTHATTIILKTRITDRKKYNILYPDQTSVYFLFFLSVSSSKKYYNI